jgi:prophage antirepressor-like protein
MRKLKHRVIEADTIDVSRIYIFRGAAIENYDDEDLTAWFSVKHVCAALKIRDVQQAIAGLADTDVAVIRTEAADMRELGYKTSKDKMQLVVNESGLYGLTLLRAKPTASAFRRWLAREVWPSIHEDRIENPVSLLPQLEASGATSPSLLEPPQDQQGELTSSMPPSVEKALDQKASALAKEAYALLREHLRRQVEDCAVRDDTTHRINRRMAIQTIRRANLNDTLAHTLEEKVHALKTMAHTCARMTQDLLAEIDDEKCGLSLLGVGGHPASEDGAACEA